MNRNYVVTVFCIFMIISGCSKNTERVNQEVPFLGTITKDVTYASNIGYDGLMADLKLDIYTPTSDFSDQNGRYPLYLHVHGGAFIKGTKEAVEDLMKLMANKGYVSVAIGYRIGWNHDDEDPDLCNGDSAELKMAIYRAMQDYNASLRFMVANADEYKIDTSKIFTGGSSAGSTTVMNAMVLTDELVAITEPEIRDFYGPLDRGGNNLTNTYTIKGHGAMWGGIGNLDYINKSNAVPAIFFHGTEDIVTPYGAGTVFQCENMITSNGAAVTYPVYELLNVKAKFHTAENQGHSPDMFDNRFLADNMDCFFSDLLNGDAQFDKLLNRESSCK